MKKPNLNIHRCPKFLIKGKRKMIKKDGLLKRLKNFEGKNEEQLKAIENQ